MTTVLHPKGNRITVLRDEEKKKTEGGIDIPDNVKMTDHCIGTVLEVSADLLHQEIGSDPDKQFAYIEGKYKARFNPNDRVLYSRFAGIDMVVGGKAICVLEDKEIIGVLEGEGE